MVYKTILLSLISFALYGQIMLNPNRANTLNPSAGGGGGVYTLVSSAGDSTGSSNPDPFDNTGWVYIGDNITPSVTRYLDKAGFHCVDFDIGLPTDTMVCEVWGMDGSGTLTTLIATSNIYTVIDTGWNDMIFPSQVTLIQDSALAIVFRKEPLGVLSNGGSIHMTYADTDWSTGEGAGAMVWANNGTRTEDYTSNSWTIRWYIYE